jgi:hypothetical protein
MSSKDRKRNLQQRKPPDERRSVEFSMPISLEGSLQPLVNAFNRDGRKHRFVALLSPT